MILRELIAKLTLDMDRRQFDQADQRVSGVKRGLDFAGQAAVALGSAMAVGLGFAIDRAGDAHETLNLMGIVFEENRQRMVAWADTFGKATGRSVFELREVSTTFGNLMKGTVGDLEIATEMAQRLSERAVDFGSALNVDLVDASEKFRSALSGEVEPLRRFGINMTVAALEAFALEEGIRGNVASMDEAEKAQLRYNFLMSKTDQFQDDAAKTAEGYANATKALRADLGDAVTAMGVKFLPAAEKIVAVARDVAQGFRAWVTETEIVRAALITFGAIGTAIAIRMAAAWALANTPILVAGAALAALVLIVEDFIVFLEGGNSAIGALIDKMFGPGSAQEAAQSLRAALDDLAWFSQNKLSPAVKEAAEGAKLAFRDLFASVENWVLENQQALLVWADGVRSLFKGVTEFARDGLALLGLDFRKLIDGMIDVLGTLFPFLERGIDLLRGLFDAGDDRTQRTQGRGIGAAPVETEPSSGDSASALFPGQSRATGLEAAIRQRFGDDQFERARALLEAARSSGPAPPIGGPAPTVAAPTTTNVRQDGDDRRAAINQSVTVTVEGHATPETARRIANDSSAELRKMYRRARAGIAQRAAR